MKKADLPGNHSDYDQAIARYHAFVLKIIDAQRVIGTKTEKEDILESVLLRCCAQWEKFVDKMLVCCINVDHSKLNDFLGVRISRNPTMADCEAILFGGKYRSNSDISQLIGFTNKILPKDSNPFKLITPTHRAKITDAYRIRNYIAHYSSYAKRSLDQMYKNSTYGLSRFQEPGRFLLANNGARMLSYLNAFESVSNDMKKHY